MNTTSFITGFLSCLLLLFTLTHSFEVSGKTIDDEHLSLIAHPSAVQPNKFLRIYPDDSSIINDHSDEHDLEKRRFNAWAGKRGLLAKRRFNAWAGRR